MADCALRHLSALLHDAHVPLSDRRGATPLLSVVQHHGPHGEVPPQAAASRNSVMAALFTSSVVATGFPRPFFEWISTGANPPCTGEILVLGHSGGRQGKRQECILRPGRNAPDICRRPPPHGGVHSFRFADGITQSYEILQSDVPSFARN